MNVRMVAGVYASANSEAPCNIVFIPTETDLDDPGIRLDTWEWYWIEPFHLAVKRLCWPSTEDERR